MVVSCYFIFEITEYFPTQSGFHENMSERIQQMADQHSVGWQGEAGLMELAHSLKST